MLQVSSHITPTVDTIYWARYNFKFFLLTACLKSRSPLLSMYCPFCVTLFTVYGPSHLSISLPPLRSNLFAFLFSTSLPTGMVCKGYNIWNRSDPTLFIIHNLHLEQRISYHNFSSVSIEPLLCLLAPFEQPFVGRLVQRWQHHYRTHLPAQAALLTVYQWLESLDFQQLHSERYLGRQ